MLLELALIRDRPAATPGDKNDGRFRWTDPSPGQAVAPISEVLGECEQSGEETSEDTGATCRVVSGTEGGTSRKMLANGKNNAGTSSFQAVDRSTRGPSINNPKAVKHVRRRTAPSLPPACIPSAPVKLPRYQHQRRAEVVGG